MELFLLWLLFGVVTAVVAANKGRSVVGWRGMRKCPFCAELIRAEAKVCRFCSREVPLAVGPGVLQCPACGKQIKPRQNEARCYLCGGPLNLGTPQPPIGRG
jgi:hypothetical protein